MRPSTRYARSGDVDIAYQVVGEGSFDLVYVPGWLTNLEYGWESPLVPNAELPTLEQRMDDVRAVMDAVGSERAVVRGHSDGGNMCVLFAATYPERRGGLTSEPALAFRAYSRSLALRDDPDREGSSP
ncbi:MAG: alpha/beta fold hydrolase [Gemmatimonadota bacterium]